MASQFVRARSSRSSLIIAALVLALPLPGFAQGGATKGTVTHDGDHSNTVVERLETQVLSFFSQHLSFAAPKT